MRKVVQIASSKGVDGHLCIVALCEDGSMWTWTRFSGKWERLPEIP